MSVSSAHVPLLLAGALLAGLSITELSVAGIYRCTNGDGEFYFSDAVCPEGFDKEVLSISPNWSSQQSTEPDTDDPFSVLNQAGMLEARKQEATLPRVREGLGQEAETVPAQDQPLMTYEEARARATKDAGYQKYGQLTNSQKERVHHEMAKYRHLPPAPREPNRNATPTQSRLRVNGVSATPVGGGNYIHNTTGHFLQGAAGGVIDTQTHEFLPTH